ncbi:hypothetical protein DIZ27_39170 [Streptomyces sp. NWU339]|nr:hypothetical protein DIZ27_39170 [Streptomyces sp. NWU339]
MQEVHTADYRVYGARKIWRELNRHRSARSATPTTTP